ncbi:hypothetical protein R1sor_006826 [Riccia sorocarpa]|uniref:LEC14B homolog n=1 Tax=Riccia sorocarpa TaxID=122646 RepID=A0ABD3HSC9_9MARC
MNNFGGINWLELTVLGAGLGTRANRPVWLQEMFGLRTRRERSMQGRGSSTRARRWRAIDGDDESENDDDGSDKEEEYETDSDFIPEDEDFEGPRSDEQTSQENEITLKDHPLGVKLRCRTAASHASCRFGKVQPGEPVNALLMVAGREMNVTGKSNFSRAEQCHMGSKYLPLHGGKVIDQMNSRAYTGQFSADGSVFVAGFQDQRIKIYNVEQGWKVQKDIICRNLRWTVTDTALSPDQRFLVYASINPIVHLVNVGNESGGVQSLANITDIHEGLDLSVDPDVDSMFGIWSLQFSHDGREIVAGANDKSIYVYDMEAQRTTSRVVAHSDDVNAVVFADNSCNVIYSGSDDSKCKVWDRRCFSQRGKAAGILEGHLEGITDLDTFGDGQYFISNSKDQTLKLWDVRKMTSHAPRSQKIPTLGWDYRWGDYPARGKNLKHPYDVSIMTYTGHRVLKTLIRCYFSPAYTTGQKYIYTGSADGMVYIFDVVTGKLVSRLRSHRGPVRDVSWHPTQPMLVTSSWDGQITKWVYSPEEVVHRPPVSFYDDEESF